MQLYHSPPSCTQTLIQQGYDCRPSERSQTRQLLTGPYKKRPKQIPRAAVRVKCVVVNAAFEPTFSRNDTLKAKPGRNMPKSCPAAVDPLVVAPSQGPLNFPTKIPKPGDPQAKTQNPRVNGSISTLRTCPKTGTTAGGRIDIETLNGGRKFRVGAQI